MKRTAFTIPAMFFYWFSFYERFPKVKLKMCFYKLSIVRIQESSKYLIPIHRPISFCQCGTIFRKKHLTFGKSKSSDKQARKSSKDAVAGLKLCGKHVWAQLVLKEGQKLVSNWTEILKTWKTIKKIKLSSVFKLPLESQKISMQMQKGVFFPTIK